MFNILLQVLDDGRLTDGQGRTVDFRNTVIVMTSNLGSHQIQDMSTDDSPEAYTQMKAAVMGVVQAHFRPEFINRLDDIVVFHPLDKQQIKQIARIQMRGLEKRLAERGLKLAVSDAAFDLLGNVGFDPVYGARPLKRAIQSQLENPLAQQILSGAFVNGDTIEVGNEGGHGLRQGLNRWRACHGWRATKAQQGTMIPFHFRRTRRTAWTLPAGFHSAWRWRSLLLLDTLQPSNRSSCRR